MLGLPQEHPAGGVRVGLDRHPLYPALTRRACFWQAALGYVPREAPQDGWVVLTYPTGTGPNLSLDRVETSIVPAPDELSPIHLDLYTEDQKARWSDSSPSAATRYGCRSTTY